MKSNNNFYRTQNGGVHSISNNSKAEHVVHEGVRPRSAHHDRMYILHSGIISASKKK